MRENSKYIEQFEKLNEISKSYDLLLTVESTSMRKDGSIEIEKLNRSLDYIYRKLEE